MQTNAFAEAWIGSLKRECLDHFCCFGLTHLDHITQSYVRFYNTHRPHQSLDNRTLDEAAAGPIDGLQGVPPALGGHDEAPPVEPGRIRCQQFLGGLLRHYYRVAA